MAWDFQREEQQFEIIPEGSYRIRIRSAEKAVSRSGNDMLALQFDVSGQTRRLYHYITFMKDRPEITNRMLTQLFDSFAGIPEGDFNLQNWIGKTGACVVKHEEYNGSDTERISYFIKFGKYDTLPAWVEPESKASSSVQTDENGFVQVPDGVEDIPF